METVEIQLDVPSAVSQFWKAPDEALFRQPVLVAITGLSAAFFERARWEGFGPKYIKLGRAVRYKKADVLAWIEKRPVVSSTTEAAAKFDPQSGPSVQTGEGPRRRQAVGVSMRAMHS